MNIGVTPSLGQVPRYFETFSPETQYLLLQMTAKPTYRRQLLVDRTIKALKAANVWDKLDYLYLMAAHAQQAGLLNWKNPTFAPMVYVGGSAPTFTVDSGYQGNADQTSVIRNGQTINSLTFSQNSAHLAVWNTVTPGSGTTADIGSSSSFPNFLGCLNTITTTVDYTVNCNTTAQAAGSGANLYVIANRSDASNQQLYKSGALSSTSVVASVADSGLIQLGSGPINTNSRIALAHIGPSLSAAEIAVLFTIFTNYLNNLTTTNF